MEVYGDGPMLTVCQIPELGILELTADSSTLTHHWSVGGQDFSLAFFLLVDVPKVTKSSPSNQFPKLSKFRAKYPVRVYFAQSSRRTIIKE